MTRRLNITLCGWRGHDPFETTLYTDNPVWKNLKFVQESRVYSLGVDTWLYGGPLSAEILADKVVASVVVAGE